MLLMLCTFASSLYILAPVHLETEVWMAPWMIIAHVLYYGICFIIGGQGFHVLPTSISPCSMGLPPIYRLPSFFLRADVTQDFVSYVSLLTGSWCGFTRSTGVPTTGFSPPRCLVSQGLHKSVAHSFHHLNFAKL